MKCPRCQREVNDDNQYCPYCGTRLLKEDERIQKEYKEIRLRQISFIMNRLLNISAIIAIVFAIIGLFGPVIDYKGPNSELEIGGLTWFSFEGWNRLNNGEISVGPFYTTFALYILLFVGVLVLASFGIYKAINGLRKNEECKTIPHIIALSLVHSIYSAFIYNFYYEYLDYGDYYFEAGSGWGETLYTLAIPLFIIALIVFLIMKSVFTAPNNKYTVKRIFTLASSLTLTTTISITFTSLGFQDVNLNETYAFGALHYFDLVDVMPGNVAGLLITSFILGTLFIGVVVSYIIISIRDLVKYNKVNRLLLFILGIAQTVIVTVMFIIAFIFGNAVNAIEGWENNIYCLTTDFSLTLLISYMVLGLSIAIFAMGKEETPNSTIIDQEVIEKHDA